MTARAAFLAHLATLDLPMPTSISFSSVGGRVHLFLDSIADAGQWSAHLGVRLQPELFQPGFLRRQASFWGGGEVAGFRVNGVGVEDVPNDEREQLLAAEAAEDIPAGGEEAAGPAEGSGSATAPSESGAQPAACLEEVGGSDSGQGKAEPPTVHDVWVSIRRRGIHYHQLDVQAHDRFTDCGRSARPNGTRLPLAEAEAFGAVPCPRCYGAEG